MVASSVVSSAVAGTAPLQQPRRTLLLAVESAPGLGSSHVSVGTRSHLPITTCRVTRLSLSLLIVPHCICAQEVPGTEELARECCPLSRVQLFCDPRDCRPPGSSVHGILQARIPECVAKPCSRESSRPRDRT